MKLHRAVFVGIMVGVTVNSLTNAALEPPWDLTWPPNLTGFWGLLYGSFASVIAVGLAMWLLNPDRSRPSQGGRLIAAFALGVFGLLVLLWIVSWGVPLFTLEGAWMYPMAGVPIAGAIALVGYRKRIDKPLRQNQLKW
jgi:hypothetical protein